MSKGRNAAKTFTATRGARFAAARAETARVKAEQRAAGTRRTMMMVAVDDVREDDEVCTTSGFVPVTETSRENWVTSAGETAVQRFVVTE